MHNSSTPQRAALALLPSDLGAGGLHALLAEEERLLRDLMERWAAWASADLLQRARVVLTAVSTVGQEHPGIIVDELRQLRSDLVIAIAQSRVLRHRRLAIDLTA